MTNLVEHTAVLNAVEEYEYQVLFTNADGDNDTTFIDLYLGVDKFNDMGQPNKITVTVEPGDKLNG